jgi:acetyltransferase-like isoleucine patch superfamily enzyme
VVGAGAVLATPGPVTFGDRVQIGRSFHPEPSLIVGDDVLISCNVAIIGDDHDFSDPSLTVSSDGRLATSTVVIEGDTLVGFGSTIIGSLRIGRAAIVGARSVVTRDVEPNTIVAGVPARVIRKRPR